MATPEKDQSPCITCPRWGTANWENTCVPSCEERERYAIRIGQSALPIREMKEGETVKRELEFAPKPHTSKGPFAKEEEISPSDHRNIIDAIRMLTEDNPLGPRKADVFHLYGEKKKKIVVNGVCDPLYSFIHHAMDKLVKEGRLVKSSFGGRFVLIPEDSVIPPKGKTLHNVDKRHRMIRKLFRGGKTIEEIVEVMEISRSTVNLALRKVKKYSPSKKKKVKGKDRPIPTLPELVAAACGAIMPCPDCNGEHYCLKTKGHDGDHHMYCLTPPAITPELPTPPPPPNPMEGKMATIISNKKETYADIDLPETLECLECHAPVHVKELRTVISGGYHAGLPNLFLCADCARRGDLHKLGYIVGDALVSNYMPHWGMIGGKVQEVVGRLERSILRAVVHQFQLRLREK